MYSWQFHCVTFIGILEHKFVPLTRRGFIPVLLLFLALDAAGQSYYFRHYQVENGLSNNAVICCQQDQKGFLWFGTKDGLNRFDGYTFKIFRNNPDDSGSIGSNFIHTLYVDPSDIMWVGTEKGLYKYDATTESFSWVPTPFSEQITDIKRDGRGNLWFISNFNLFKYYEPSHQLDQFKVPDYFEATSICTLPDSSVWVSSSNGFLKKYNFTTHSFQSFNLFDHSQKTVSNWVEKLYGTRDGNLLVGTSNQGVKFFDTHTGAYRDILTYNADKTEIFARNFVQTTPDECWIATESGIYIYDMSTGKTTNLHKEYNNPYSISDNAVYTFCYDKEGGIWAGTYFGGVNYYPRQPLAFTKYFPEKGKNSLSGNVVREVHQDQYGHLWIGTEDAGLNKYDTSSGLFTSFQPTGAKDAISYTNIHGLLATGNELWIGTFEHGLDVMNIQTGKIIRHYSKQNDAGSLRSNFIYCIYQSPAGQVMLGTTIGAYQYNRATDNFTPLKGFPLFNWYSSLLQEDDSTIWACTYGNGIHYYNPKTNKGAHFRYNSKDKNSLASDRVNSIFEDSNKNLWFATEGGLCKYDRQKNNFTRYTTANGLPTNFILSLLEDSKKNLWITTSRGLVSFDPVSGLSTVYTKANGLLNDQFNFSSAYKDAEGRMYFGSVKGLISFRPDEFVKSNFTPLVYITGFQVNNNELVISKDNSPLAKSITYTHKIELTHNQSTFSIDFASLSYTAPEMSEYAYKMDGLENDWTYLKTNRKVYFTNLSPGTYTFKIKASINNGSWNGPETTLTIEILPPWWASRWAYIVYLLLASAIIYFLIRNYHRRINEKNRRKIELLEHEKEKEIYHAKIEFFTNVAHEIKTPLTLIKGPMEKIMKKNGHATDISGNLKLMEKNTNRLIELTNQLLDFRKTETKGFSLNFVKTNISSILADTYNSFKILAESKSLIYQLDSGEKEVQAYVDTDAFSKILNNLFNNAIKYARSEIQIGLTLVNEEKIFQIIIKNDGYLIPKEMKDKIFEPFFRMKETEKLSGSGIGLSISKSLAELHNGKLELTDAHDGMNTFVLSLPVHQQIEFDLHRT